MSTARLPLLLLLLGVARGFECPAQQGAYALCATTVVYILDTTVYMSSADINTEFDWIRNHILPGTAWGTQQELALISYGTGNVQSYNTISVLSQACLQLDGLQNSWLTQGSSNVTLLKTMQAVDLYYADTVNNMVLFTASKNLDDIAKTGKYIQQNMPTQHLTVIAMDGANFTGFPATVIYEIPSLADSPPNLPSCIIKNACNQGETCDINGVTDAPVYFPTTTIAPATTTRATTTALPSTVTPARTAAPPTPTPSSGPQTTGPQCQCNTTTAWVDMIYVMDASAAATNGGLEEMWATAGTMLDFFTVTKVGFTGSNYTSRVGVITYGNAATVIAPLGSVTGDDLDQMESLPYNGDSKTNLEAGIQAAVAQFDGSAHRANCRKVMIIMASTYNGGGVTAPQQAANTFKENGGIIIVYNYVQDHGDQTNTLQEIASPGYFYSTLNQDTYQDVMNGVCEANCFCANNYDSFTNSLRGAPNAGCYAAAETQSNYRLAVNKCKSFNNGFLAYDETAAKNTYLSGLFIHQNSQFLIDLTYDGVTGKWEWGNGNPVGSYQPWSSTPNGANGLTCVYVNANGQWQQTDCRNGYLYVCEAPPCDSMHYCP